MSNAIHSVVIQLIDSRDRLIEASELRGGLAADDAVREQCVQRFNELMAAACIPDAVHDAAILHAARLGGDATARVRAACAALDAMAERVRRDWPGDVGVFGSDEWRALNEAITALRPYADAAEPAAGAVADAEPAADALYVDARAQTITSNGSVIHFGGSEAFGAFVKLWNNRPDPIDLDGERDGRKVAADIRAMLKSKGLNGLAAVVKNQRGVGYYIDLHT